MPVTGPNSSLFDESPPSSQDNQQSESKDSNSQGRIYLVRVVLHEVDESKYPEFHDEMKKRGFHKSLNGNDLPDGQYLYPNGSLSQRQISGLVDQAANTINAEDHSIVIAEVVDLGYVNLRPSTT